MIKRAFLCALVIIASGYFSCQDVIDEEVIDEEEVVDEEDGDDDEGEDGDTELQQYGFTFDDLPSLYVIEERVIIDGTPYSDYYEYEGEYISEVQGDRMEGVLRYEYENDRMVKDMYFRQASATNPDKETVITYPTINRREDFTERWGQTVRSEWINENQYEVGLLSQGQSEWDGFVRIEVEDGVAVSRTDFRMDNGEEKEIKRTFYTYDKKVRDPYFARYGHDIFQSPWLPTKVESYLQHLDGEWFLSFSDTRNYEVNEEDLPVQLLSETFVYDIASISYADIRYFYRE